MVSVDLATPGTVTAEENSATSIYNELNSKATEEFKSWLNPQQPRIDVAKDTSSLANGSDTIEKILTQHISESNFGIDIGHVHGYGMQVPSTILLLFLVAAQICILRRMMPFHRLRQ